MGGVTTQPPKVNEPEAEQIVKASKAVLGLVPGVSEKSKGIRKPDGGAHVSRL